MHRDEWDDEDEEPKWAGAPLTTKEKDMLRYYYYIHNGIDTRFVFSTVRIYICSELFYKIKHVEHKFWRIFLFFCIEYYC